MSDHNVRTVLELYKKDAVTIDQAINLLAAVMIENASAPTVSYNSNNWTHTTTWDESLSTEQK